MVERQYRCDVCDKTLMILEPGSLVKPDVILFCKGCIYPESIKNYKDNAYDDNILEQLRGLMGMKWKQ
jgi:hypothetical protein